MSVSAFVSNYLPRKLSWLEFGHVAGGDKLHPNATCKKDPAPENSAFGYVMLALAIVLL